MAAMHSIIGAIAFGLVLAPAGSSMSEPDVVRTSLHEILAARETFDGSMVLVRGFCCKVGNEFGILMSPADCEAGNALNGVLLDLSPSQEAAVAQYSESRICTIEGEFESWKHSVVVDTHFESGAIRVLRHFPH